MTDRNSHYRVAEGADAWALETAVKSLMDEGWIPQGGVCVVPAGVGEAKFFQAMTQNNKPAAPSLPAVAVAVPEAVADPGVM
ncbi:DUF1737 domain-containing protein [Limnoglobus roseus]|uniref:DUF1737 domain-containing protein n=1 Tax=Limnoglobus roseus TaxID=2598579 RepID=A0A5C1AJN9_9BACT|nr:DUF1737 domain-containing protein [Limnoglobus roseus]QEL18397.1 hypothetical protein PX52LOC_05421 [Limnoglobus roseus]